MHGGNSADARCGVPWPGSAAFVVHWIAADDEAGLRGIEGSEVSKHSAISSQHSARHVYIPLHIPQPLSRRTGRYRFPAAGCLIMWWLLSSLASATTYYVDPAGANQNDGLTPQTPWRTLLKVGISTFNPGDQILFKRDGVWNEWLTPPSSGAAGNLIKFDAYGNGLPPEFTGRYATSSSQWTNTSGNVWRISLSATQTIETLNFVQFGTIWGSAQTSQAALGHDRDWYYDPAAQNLYVYSSGGNPVTAFGSVTPIILSGQSLINLNNVSFVEIQHIKLDWYDGYGVQIQGASDHLWLANMVADSQVPNNTVPIGFYVHASGTPADIHIFNTDAQRNYVGYRIDGTGTAYELKNCRAYGNRTYGLIDDGINPGWAGEYDAWSDFLPGNAEDIFPGDAMDVNVPSQHAIFRAIVREVNIAVLDLDGEHSQYKIRFADDAAEPLAFAFDTAMVSHSLNITATDVAAIGASFLSDLTASEITQVTSTTVSIDAGTDVSAGIGFEVRRSDSGWGQDNDRNLVGRFSTRNFSVPRLARVQDYFLRQYDNSIPARYSRYSAGLHIDYPL